MFRYYALYHLKTNRQLRLGTAFFAVGLLLMAGAWRVGSQWNWTPVDVPLPLNGPISLNVPFTTHTPHNERYSIRAVPALDHASVISDDAFPSAEGQNLQVYAEDKLIEVSHRTPDCIQLNHSSGYFSVPSERHCVLHLNGNPLPPE